MQGDQEKAMKYFYKIGKSVRDGVWNKFRTLFFYFEMIYLVHTNKYFKN